MFVPSRLQPHSHCSPRVRHSHSQSPQTPTPTRRLVSRRPSPKNLSSSFLSAFPESQMSGDLDKSSRHLVEARVAVINCPGAVPFTPLFSAMFDRAAAADRDDGGVNAEVNVTEYQAEAGKLPSLDGNYDAYAITGSRYGSYETDEWINILKTWVREARRKDARVLGVCFGHQVIADALGGDGTVEVNAAGFEFGTYRFQPDERFVQIAEQLYDVPPPPSGSIDMFYVHGDHVKPSALNGLELENMGGTDVSPCEGLFDAKQGRFLTLQGHPEFDEATMLACHTSLTDKRRLPGAMPGETDSEKSDLLRRQLASCSEAPACQAWLAQLCTSFLTADVRRAE